MILAAYHREPLFLFANWRGFSGGMKDMFDQVRPSFCPLEAVLKGKSLR